jgi:hypothetical protein
MTQTVSVTDFIRNFGTYADLLPKLDSLLLIRDGKYFATLKSTPTEKNKNLLKFSGVWKGTSLDKDSLWKRVLTRKNRISKTIL